MLELRFFIFPKNYKGVYKKFVSPIFSDLMCEESFTKYVRQYVKCKYSKKTFKHRSGKILNSESPVNLKKRKFSPRTHSLSIETEEIWFPCESEEEKNQENEHENNSESLFSCFYGESSDSDKMEKRYRILTWLEMRKRSDITIEEPEAETNITISIPFELKKLAQLKNFIKNKAGEYKSRVSIFEFYRDSDFLEENIYYSSDELPENVLVGKKIIAMIIDTTVTSNFTFDWVQSINERYIIEWYSSHLKYHWFKLKNKKLYSNDLLNWLFKLITFPTHYPRLFLFFFLITNMKLI